MLLAVAVVATGLAVAPVARAQTVSQGRPEGLALWRQSGPAVRRVAERALAGGDDEVAHFFASDLAEARYADQRGKVEEFAASGGPRVRAAAKRALAAPGTAAVDAFLLNGWKVPWQQD